MGDKGIKEGGKERRRALRAAERRVSRKGEWPTFIQKGRSKNAGERALEEGRVNEARSYTLIFGTTRPQKASY
jgi:hypothetical protein